MSDERPSNVPADQGLSTLGLLMQLFGTLFGVLSLALIVLFFDLGDQHPWLLLIGFGVSAARAFVHARAGAELKSGFAGVRRYIVVAVLHTAVIVALDLVGVGTSLRGALAGAAGLLVWPAALAVMIRMPRFSRFDAGLPLAEDKGFEGLAILMAIMGAVGAIQWGAMLIVLLFSLPDIIELGDIYAYLFFAAVTALFIRSYVHVSAGLAGVRETSFARSVKLGNRYAIVGFAVSMIVTGILVFVAIFEMPDFSLFAMIACACWMLFAWPLIVRKFVGERQLASLADDDIHHRAPDAGLTGLGWLLVANGMLTLTFLLPNILAGSGSIGAFAGITHVAAKVVLVEPSAMAWNLGICAVELWAGIELVSMSSRLRIAATAYALVAGAWAVIHTSPQMLSFETMRHLAPEDVMDYVPLATNLVLPVAALLLVRRRTVPRAEAQ
ncbi:MAG TPA: hypothetical protein VGM39_01090 [Kofleriaceae bacterium]